MSEHALKLSPRDVANTAEATVVSLPQRVLSLLLCLSLSGRGDEEFEDLPAQQARQRSEIDAAIEYLKNEFEPAFKEASGDVNAPLAEARKALHAEIVFACSKLPAVGAPVATGLILDLKERAETELGPAVSAFLSALFDSVVAYEKSSAKLAKDVESSSLAQIDSISRQISFIAVNASVEAARAGEAGRGFGVIASEIKQLSEQARTTVDRVRSSLS